MSNLEGGKYYEEIEEWSVPIHEGKITARDMDDLMRKANARIGEIDPEHAGYDDAYHFEPDEDRIYVRFRTRVETGSTVLT